MDAADTNRTKTSKLWARKVRQPETFESHVAEQAASPFAEFGPCRCSRWCDRAVRS